MEKVIKSYVQKMCSDPWLCTYLEDEEVKERDPMQIENDGNIQGFRFYDIEFVIDGSKVYTGEKENYSKWVYFGKRISIDELKAKHKILYFRSLVRKMEIEDSQYICYTQGGFQKLMEEEDMTYNELVAQKESEKEKMDIDKSKLMEGLALIKPETAVDWFKFVDDNINDESSVLIAKATISMMKKFEEGLSFEEAEQQVYNEEFKLSELMIAATASAISHFAKKGEEYRDYWNKKYGIEDPEIKETSNPNMLKK